MPSVFPRISMKRKHNSESLAEPELSFVGDDDSKYFAEIHGRKINTMNQRYMLPADEDEIKRSGLHHRVVNWIFAGKNYVGPVKEILSINRGHRKSRVLDLGTGGGNWAIDIADEFPAVDVIGVDLAPIQPRDVPVNCTFELCDLDQYNIPYPNEYFDVIHARSMHHGVKNYPRFLQEVARILRPGGLLLLIEPDTEPLINGQFAADLARAGSATGVPAWVALWRAFRSCLRAKGVDLAAPGRLRKLLQGTGAFGKVVTQQAEVPIGFWPQDDTQLTIGQLAWMEHDLLLPGMRPLLLSTSGKTEAEVQALIENAQHDLYYPQERLSSRLHVAHARKKI
ncbi:hypothetical protein HWV62_5921 [Athelia sp. TMB]|nr:hypothetical protein HWV62_7096 [Athelia sp. TMB]KAF7976732.1 hypothetical protein HWV62_5921 [Athelia sp. TMB]